MAENIRALEIKKRKLKEELNSENPDKKIIKRLRESIKRHKEIALSIRNKRMKAKRRQRH